MIDGGESSQPMPAAVWRQLSSTNIQKRHDYFASIAEIFLDFYCIRRSAIDSCLGKLMLVFNILLLL